MTQLKRALEPTPEQADCLNQVPRPARVKLRLPVTLELAPEGTVDGVIRDLSSDGFCLKLRRALIVNDRFTMHMVRGKATCQVRWVNGSICGGVFDEKVSEHSW